MLHGNEGKLVWKFNKIVNADDVWMAEQSSLLYFTYKITEGDGVIGKFGRKALDGNGLL